VAGSTFWFLEAAPVSVRFHATEADFREPEVDSLARVGEPEVELLVPAADFRERADDSHEPEVDSLARVGEPGVELPVPVADFRA
jgi:hypothetical protein